MKSKQRLYLCISNKANSCNVSVSGNRQENQHTNTLALPCYVYALFFEHFKRSVSVKYRIATANEVLRC